MTERRGRVRAWYQEEASTPLFRCLGTTCSDCCSGRFGSGTVDLSPSDLRALAAHLAPERLERGEDPAHAIGHLLTPREDGGWGLRETEDLDCVLLAPLRGPGEPRGCMAYAARPEQCRSYPFWPEIIESESRWLDECAVCPGIELGDPAADRMHEAALRAPSPEATAKG